MTGLLFKPNSSRVSSIWSAVTNRGAVALARSPGKISTAKNRKAEMAISTKMLCVIRERIILKRDIRKISVDQIFIQHKCHTIGISCGVSRP